MTDRPLTGPTAWPCPACGAVATESCRFDDGTDGGDATVHIERIWAALPVEQRPPDTGNPGRDAVNYAYSISPVFGEAAIAKMCELCQERKVDHQGRAFIVPPWWRWTTWLAGAIVIQRNRQKLKSKQS